MGNSIGRRKKGNGGAELDSSKFLKSAHELKEEGNRRFQSKDYFGALELYEKGLELIPKTHSDRAVFHSNKAACLMHMKPIDYELVIAECTMALQVQPQFVMALVRRASAFEAIGKHEMAVQDVKVLLGTDPTHPDALEIAQRLRTVLGPKKQDKSQLIENGPETKSQLKPSNSNGFSNPRKENHKWRPLKLVYDHDIRLAQMPSNCRFRVLRDIVSKRFPSSKSVLIKYKDYDGDLVTITSTHELRLAETSVDESDSVGMLRLNIVKVSPEQEPPLLEEEEEKPIEVMEGDESESVSKAPDTKADKIEKDGPKEKPVAIEVEMDDWLFEFAQLFRSHVGIDPDAHIDLHELGMEICSEALEETVTSEEAQDLFDKAASKFQEVAALAFFNWGNVHMCAASKRIPLDESVVAERLQIAYDWVKEKYSLARDKYEQALLIKPDFYEGLLALGQQQFEMAKLHWSFTLAKKVDLSGLDSTETLQLFNSAEEKMRAATDIWEKLEELRANELKDANTSKKEELLRRTKIKGGATESESSSVVGGQGDISAEEAIVMRSQIHLFWGNMLFERSQVECKLGMGDWKKNLDAAIERFKLAGAAEADISMVIKNHCFNGDAREGEVKGSVTYNRIALVK